MADAKQLITDEVVDQVVKLLKDKTTAKLLKATNQTNLTDVDIQSKLRSLGFKDIANDPKKYKKFRSLSKLPLSEFKWRLARLMVGVGAALGREKYTTATKNLPDSAKILSHGAFAVFRGSAKDFAEKSVRNRGFKQVLNKPELMKNIAKSLREQNSFTRDKLRE